MSDLPPILPPELPGDPIEPDLNPIPEQLPTTPTPGQMPGDSPIPAVL